MRRALPWALVVALCIPALLPLGPLAFFTTDDGLFHLYRVAALDDALQHGELYPRLFPSFAFGYGQPVLGYYGPLGYYVAELAHWLGATFPDALKWAFGLGLVASGCTLFLLASDFVPPGAAVLAAIAYVYFPYHLSDAYQRGALAEQLAFVWLPLILWGLTPARFASPVRSAVGGGGIGASAHLLIFTLSLTALLLTHLLSAMIFLPFALVYGIVMYRPASGNPSGSDTTPPKDLIRTVSGRYASPAFASLLAFGLSAFYWLPVLLQSRWVGLSAGDNQGYRAHLASLFSFVQPSLFFRYRPDQIVSADYPLGLLSFALLLAALLAAARAWRARAPSLTPRLLFPALALAALLMTLDLSLPVWQALQPLLAFLQYPWRFMALAGLGLGLCAAFLFAGYTRLALLAALVLLVSAILPLRLPLHDHPPYSDTPVSDAVMWQNDYRLKQIGATWTAEYMPWWVRADRTDIPNTSRSAASDVSLPVPQFSLWDAGTSLAPLDEGYTRRDYRLSGAAQPGCVALTVRFHQFYLPQWRVKLGSRPLSPYPSTDLGLLSVDVPCGPASELLTLEYGLTDAEQVASVVSLVAGALVLWLWRGRWLFGALLVLALVSALALVRSAHDTPLAAALDAQVGDVADLVAVRFERDRFQSGDDLRVTLTWLARRQAAENYKVFVHLMAPDGAQVLAQSDGDPVGGFTPTSQWRSGEVIEDTRVLHIPDSAVGDLALFAGMYRYPDIQNLPALRDGLAFPGNRIPLGVIHVAAR